jgi:hypothetical protein
MTLAFYKTNDSAVMGAVNAYFAKIEEIRAAGKAFADHFGGNLLVKHNIHGFEIGGLYFNPPIKPRLWTAPDRSAMGRQRPRASIVRPTPEEKAALKALSEDWDKRFPKEKANLEPVLTAIGTDWGALMFGGGYAMHLHADYMYVTASVKLADCMVEILASEYQAAKAASEACEEPA